MVLIQFRFYKKYYGPTRTASTNLTIIIPYCSIFKGGKGLSGSSLIDRVRTAKSEI